MSPIATLIGIAIPVSLAIVGIAYGPRKAVVAITSIATNRDPDKLGWLDNATLTDADRTRLAFLSGANAGSNLDIIRNIQSGGRGNVTRRDFELLRQDRRRAKAAYPNVSDDDLYDGGWLQVDLHARIPMEFCTSGNSNGTEADGKMYLDGGCYVSAVQSKYPNREDAVTTKRILAELNDVGRKKQIAYIVKWGYHTWWSGTDGSVSVHGYPDPLPSDKEADGYQYIAGQVVIIIDNETIYQFPFTASDWIDAPSSKDGLIKLAKSRNATVSDYVAPPVKPFIVKDGLLAHGEVCSDGRLCWSKWNGDGYDNNDIGPSNPESWVLEQPFGIGYLPASDNGERRSDPGKPWFLVITYYGMPPQISGGWTEREAKETLPRFQTGHSWGMMGQNNEELNKGNLKEARATQRPPSGGVIVLSDRAHPVQPAKTDDPHYVPYSSGMTLMPGQSTGIGINR